MPKLYSPNFLPAEFAQARAQIRADLITAHGYALTDRVRLAAGMLTLEGQTKSGDWHRITNSTPDMSHYLKSQLFQTYRLSADVPSKKELTMWSLYDPPEDDHDDQQGDVPADPADLEPLPDFPTLTDCPLCGSRNPETCGCFENADLWPIKEERHGRNQFRGSRSRGPRPADRGERQHVRRARAGR